MKASSGLPRALTIAGSDSSGGAGIQADLKTFAALGCYGMSAITALTAQNTQGVHGVFSAPPEFAELQIRSVLNDIGADAIKTGMLFDAGIITAVTRSLADFEMKNLVIDPVMYAKDGAPLLQEKAIQALIDQLLPRAALVTPNLPEAEKLSEIKISGEDSMQHCAEKLLSLGARGALIKGGHLSGKSADDFLLYRKGDQMVGEWLRSERVETRNTHGTGCTLSAAITAYLARGFDISAAVKSGKEYLRNQLTKWRDTSIGNGIGPASILITGGR